MRVNSCRGTRLAPKSKLNPTLVPLMGVLVRLCYYAVVRTTLDISDEAYYIAKAIARDQNRSLGRVVGDLILQSSKGTKGVSIRMSDYGFPTFRCARPVTTDDVKALDDEE